MGLIIFRFLLLETGNLLFHLLDCRVLQGYRTLRFNKTSNNFANFIFVGRFAAFLEHLFHLKSYLSLQNVHSIFCHFQPRFIFLFVVLNVFSNIFNSLQQLSKFLWELFTHFLFLLFKILIQFFFYFICFLFNYRVSFFNDLGRFSLHIFHFLMKMEQWLLLLS